MASLRVASSCNMSVIIIVICIVEKEVGIYLFTYLGWYAIKNNSMDLCLYVCVKYT